MGDFPCRVHVKVSNQMQADIARLAEDIGWDEPKLVRALLGHALENPPELMADLADSKRQLRERDLEAVS